MSGWASLQSTQPVYCEFLQPSLETSYAGLSWTTLNVKAPSYTCQSTHAVDNVRLECKSRVGVTENAATGAWKEIQNDRVRHGVIQSGICRGRRHGRRRAVVPYYLTGLAFTRSVSAGLREAVSWLVSTAQRPSLMNTMAIVSCKEPLMDWTMPLTHPPMHGLRVKANFVQYYGRPPSYRFIACCSYRFCWSTQR
jgi:hypothetical protein